MVITDLRQTAKNISDDRPGADSSHNLVCRDATEICSEDKLLFLAKCVEG